MSERCPTCKAENRDEPEMRECTSMCPAHNWRWVKDEFLNCTDKVVCADPFHEYQPPAPAESTPSTPTDERAEFEEWWLISDVDAAWRAWQAREAQARREALEQAAKALCEWCEAGKPIAEPMYGRVNEIWHVPFPEHPKDTQRVRCRAEKVRALSPVVAEEGKQDAQ